MSLSTLMNATCTIQNPGSSVGDSGGEEESWNNLATGVKCRVWQLKADEQYGSKGKGGTSEVLVTHKGVLPYGQTVSEGHRLTSVVSADGTTLVSVADIEAVNPDAGAQQHHVEIWLKSVRTS